MTGLAIIASKATYIVGATGAARDYNYGGAAVFLVGGGMTVLTASGLLYFDLSGLDPTAIINSATLSLWSAQSAATQSHKVSLIPVADINWVEGTQVAAIEVGANCWNWHTYNTQAWSGGAGCLGGALLGTMAYPNGAQYAEVQLALSAAVVQAWVGPAGVNPGLVVQYNSGPAAVKSYVSDDGAQLAMRPLLTLDYTIPPPPVMPPYAIPGRDIGLLVNTGTWSAPVFEPLAGQRVVDFGEGTEPIDWSSKDSRFRRIMPGRYSSDVSAGGLYVPDDPPYLALQGAMRGHELILIRRCEDGIPIEDAIALVKAISIDAPDNDVGLMAVGLVVDGWWFPAVP